MKKLIFSAGFLALLGNCLGQQISNRDRIVKNSEFYLQKSKNQKKAAWVFLGSGIGISLISLAMVPKDLSLWGNSPETESRANTAGVFLAVGISSMLTSIPFFTSSVINKSKSIRASVGLKFESRPVVRKVGPGNKEFPALSIKISL